MQGRPPSDLVMQMWYSIHEEVPLWMITQQITDYGSGPPVVHGPWEVADCQQILIRWSDRGLLDCVATAWATTVGTGEIVHYDYATDWRPRATRHGQFLTLARADTDALLRDPSTWDGDGSGAGVDLCPSDAADGLPFDAWFDQLAGLPDHLIYEQPGSRKPTAPKVGPPWVAAIEEAAAGRPMRCPVNQDAQIEVSWDPTTGETATSESIEDIVCFVDPVAAGQRQPFPFGRHRLRCPACGAERHLVVIRRPG